MTPLKGKKIILGIGGGIAAYKACDLVRRLQDQGGEVHVVLTQAAQKFVTALTFQALSQQPVHTDLFNLTEESEMSHIKLADEANLMLIAPATADLIAKLAVGLSNDLLTTIALVTRAPIFLAPSMNVNMWQKEVVQQNIQSLRDRGFQIIEPDEGPLACGWEGKGRLSDPNSMVKTLTDFLSGSDPSGKKKALIGKKILINAGPTREFLDPVRYLSNPSSGKMGFALAQAAISRGAEVTLISGPVSLPTPSGARRIDTVSAEDLFASCQSEFPKNDIFIATAAVGDYRPKEIQNHKIKKSGKEILLKLSPNPDILKSLSKQKSNGQVLVGFAAETQAVEKQGRKKLAEKGLDLMVANDVSKAETGFGSDFNEVILIDRHGDVTPVKKIPKTQLAHIILDHIEKLI